MQVDLVNAITLLKQNKLQAAFRIINQSLDSMGRMIKSQDPEIFYMLSGCTLQLDDDMDKLLTVSISQMHGVVLGPQHPLSLVWNKLRHMLWVCRARTISMVAFDSAQFLETRLGIQNGAVYSAVTSMTSVLYSFRETDGKEFRMVLSKYATAAETYLAEGDSLRSCQWFLKLAGFQCTAGQYEPARYALTRAFALVQDGDKSSGSHWLIMEFCYYYLMANLHSECGTKWDAESLEY
ncbi:uncharacterized protein GLRG_07866 [Colletotrichum graminicola M1.001]|uniref:Uncharacterized protein n=1 Tax=Colletotrichum graminicola (strain M1.001 / M2 / FGSC 10212) TaxID=645133 RepID=E3QPD4_COLGM|nr:uncharacterized protein GLRG_07866 [Colletotrichum graminicola M1.001]EFQ32722.1 hypothetical protein GLRG_07866 [Colletotrichum graminicola M1.001]